MTLKRNITTKEMFYGIVKFFNKIFVLNNVTYIYLVIVSVIVLIKL